MSYQLQVRLDDSVKKPFEEICDALGLSMSNAVNLFARAVVRERGIPFEMKLPEPFYSKSNVDWIKQGIAQHERGEGATYDDVDQIIADRQ
ncbi:MAG: type II toxin-antitoxin system RelB/DinJ family antitoxin [Peptococcaceae bacterium]|jgi:DNA-damage-inducible protein J|nr:type II toxin-antitoxin system RelB/DinJ family antitoxin [Peptococcaceae bacterium]